MLIISTEQACIYLNYSVETDEAPLAFLLWEEAQRQGYMADIEHIGERRHRIDIFALPNDEQFDALFQAARRQADLIVPEVREVFALSAD